MIKGLAVGTAVNVDQHKGRAGSRVERAPASTDALHECCFARTHLTDQVNHIPWLEQGPQSHSHPAGLFRAAADDFQGMRGEDWHKEIISRNPPEGEGALTT